MSKKKCKKDCDCKCKCPKEKKKTTPTDPFVEEEAFFDINEYKKKEEGKKGE